MKVYKKSRRCYLTTMVGLRIAKAWLPKIAIILGLGLFSVYQSEVAHAVNAHEHFELLANANDILEAYEFAYNKAKLQNLAIPVNDPTGVSSNKFRNEPSKFINLSHILRMFGPKVVKALMDAGTVKASVTPQVEAIFKRYSDNGKMSGVDFVFLESWTADKRTGWDPQLTFAQLLSQIKKQINLLTNGQGLVSPAVKLALLEKENALKLSDLDRIDLYGRVDERDLLKHLLSDGALAKSKIYRYLNDDVMQGKRERDQYSARLTFRKQVFAILEPPRGDWTLYQKFANRMFSNYLDRVPEEDRSVLSLTRGRILVPGNPTAGGKFFKQLRETFRLRGTRLELLFGLLRERLLGRSQTGIIPDEVRFVSSFIGHGTGVDGIDISGEMVEKLSKGFISEKEVEIYFQNLVTLFRGAMMARNARSLKIGAESPMVRLHYFQAPVDKKSELYVKLWDAIDRALELESGGTLLVRIGHISNLETQDIEKIVALREKYKTDHSSRLQFICEANVASNEAVQGSDIQALGVTIDRLSNAGIPVLLGQDGGGILAKDSSMTETLNRLKEAGVSPTTLDWLVKSAITYVEAGPWANPETFTPTKPYSLTMIDHFKRVIGKKPCLGDFIKAGQ